MTFSVRSVRLLQDQASVVYSRYLQALVAQLDQPCYEPEPRLCAGKFGYVRHRFPVKGGISLNRMMQRQMAESLGRPNAFWRPTLRGPDDK